MTTTVVRIKTVTRDRLNAMKEGRETTDDLVNRALDALQEEVEGDQWAKQMLRETQEKNRAKRQER